MANPTIFWFRRDLRLSDHPALAVAGSDGGPVVGLFVFDQALWDRSGVNRRAFLVDSLRWLDQAMGGGLVIRSGQPERVLPAICRQLGVDRVVATEDFGPYGRSRDQRVAEALTEVGASLDLTASPYAVRPGSVLTGSGRSYRVFTPFYRAWVKHGWSPPGQALDINWVGADGEALPEVGPVSAALPPAGEAAAWERTEQFLEQAVGQYSERRDLPALDGTSRLSPYLKWGTIHPRQLLDRLGPSGGDEVFRKELAWREFYADVLYDRPDSARQAYRAEMAAMEVDEGPDTDRRFEAWAEGRTGYPIVDAGMRQLVAEGWMHNRVRMIVASFLVKDLHLDWTRGARFFMQHLVDGDLASNNHGWQWVAGTGTDAAPYFRVFNPVAQGEKYDPAGAYVRRWVPELSLMPDSTVHAPWTEKRGAPASYPAPIVDHAVERQEALDRYARLRAAR